MAANVRSDWRLIFFRLPIYCYNWVSILGAYVAGLALVLILLFFGVSVFFEFATNPYLGIVQFLVLPAVFVSGLILIPIGMFLTRRRVVRQRSGDEYPWPRVDLNKRSHRNAATIFAFGSVIVIFVSAVGGYQTFHYSESVEFCGTTCHDVMKPEYVAYQNSAHARVPCAECHIGAGADWFVKSKLSGAYQVYAVLADVYSRPIPTPIENLRPAQETCEQCHWPAKFYGSQLKTFNHFMYDEGNKPWNIELLLQTGGGDDRYGTAHGIHWHMNIGFEIQYVARDHERQVIPWVRVRSRETGEVSIYQSEAAPLTAEELAGATRRTMDCVDCHNRPSHIYRSPDYAIDRGLLNGTIDRSLPQIKEVAVEAMDREYATEGDALKAIAKSLTEFYQQNYPDVYSSNGESIDAAIAAVQSAFSQNIFPEMRVRWSVYPGNLGHFGSPGCMRCHNSDLVNEKGVSVTNQCTACHTILSQGTTETIKRASDVDGLEFLHPEGIDEAWREMGCFECHSGIQP